MAFPEDFVFHNGLWYGSDGSGPYFINEAGTALPIQPPCEFITEAALARPL